MVRLVANETITAHDGSRACILDQSDAVSAIACIRVMRNNTRSFGLGESEGTGGTRMADKRIFASRTRPRSPVVADALNREKAPAYDYEPKAKLAQLAATGTLADTFYGSAQTHLKEALEAARAVEPLFAAKTAVYARKTGAMKDMPALLAAYLTIVDIDLAVRAFTRVIDNGRMLRSFVQILRSGQIGRSSLGTRPKQLVKEWLERASMRDLMAAATGNNPSLADIVRMVHPKPANEERRAFYGWLIGKPYDVIALPREIAAFEAWKRTREAPLPPVPFEWLTAYPLSLDQWGELAIRMGRQTLRANVNTLARHGAFGVEGVTDIVADRIAGRTTGASSGILPHQLLTALSMSGDAVPLKVRSALAEALEASLVNVPALPGKVVVCPDVSGSMQSPATGYRKGASSRVRCIDIAALVVAAVLRANPGTRMLPFAERVVPIDLDPKASVAVNTARLAAIRGGGTAVSEPLRLLADQQAEVDLVVVVSDNQSWMDTLGGPATASMVEWERIAKRNPGARLLCVDIQPHGTTQASGRAEILNIGGFSDAVFELMARFEQGEVGSWVELIDRTEV